MNFRPRHRRWLVFVLLAAALGMAAAQLTHRPGDPRFVGIWTVDNGSAALSWPPFSIELRADGTGTWWSSNIPRNRIYAPYPLRWSANGNCIIWRHEYGSLSEAIYGEFDRLRHRASNGDSFAPHENVLEIVDVANDEIQVDMIAIDHSRSRCILRRAE